MQRGVEGLFADTIHREVISVLNSNLLALTEIVILGAPEPVCAESMQGTLVKANPGFFNLFQIPIEDVRGRALYELLPNRAMLSLTLDAATVRRTGQDFSLHVVLPLPDGNLRGSVIIQPIRDGHGRIAGSATSFNPPLEQGAVDDGMDAMSGLMGRNRLEHTITDLEKNGTSSFAVMVVDGDGFKRINDQDGHTAGDLAIGQLAALVRYSVRRSDIKARWGGDEVVVIAPGAGIFEGRKMLKRLHETVERYNNLCPGCYLQLSAGMAVAETGREIQEAFDAADAEMRKVKEKKRQLQENLAA